jgi:hypothetical protein
MAPDLVRKMGAVPAGRPQSVCLMHDAPTPTPPDPALPCLRLDGQGIRSMALARAVGVSMVFGSDLLGWVAHAHVRRGTGRGRGGAGD